MTFGSKLLLALLVLIVVLFAVATPFGARRAQESPPQHDSVKRDSFPLLTSVENRFGKKRSDVDTARLRQSGFCVWTGDQLKGMPGGDCNVTIRPDSGTRIAYLVLQLASGSGTVSYTANGESSPKPQQLKTDSLLRVPIRSNGGLLTVTCPLGCIVKIPR